MLFVSFPSPCQECCSARGSWGHTGHLVAALLAEQCLPPVLAGTFNLIWMAIRSHIPDRKQGAETEAEIQCHEAPQRLPVGNWKPCADASKGESLNSTFCKSSKHFARFKSQKISEYKAIPSGSRQVTECSPLPMQKGDLIFPISSLAN